MLRSITLTRLTVWFPVAHPRLQTLLLVSWTQGLAPLLFLTAAAVIVSPFRRSIRRWFLAAYVLLLVATMFVGPFQPLRYHGTAVLAMLVLAGIGIGQLLQMWPKAAPYLVAAALALPAVQAVRDVFLHRSVYVRDDATNWVERHIPEGTRVYDYASLDLRCPLPTAQASDALWADVTDAQSWRRKFNRGLSRLDIAPGAFPRALSEDNLVKDRGLWRRFFILGGQPNSPRPRYDLRIFAISPTFGVQDIAAAFLKQGGVVIWRSIQPALDYDIWSGDQPGPPPELGRPIIEWVNSAGIGTFIYCSPDLMQKLLDPEHLQDW